MKFILFPPGLIKYPTAMHPWEHDGVSLKDVTRIVKNADALGYDYVNMPDHIVISAEEAQVLGPTWPELFTSLAFFAGITDRIGLYTCVLVVPYRNPYLLAKGLATIDWLSGGRLAMAVGAGHAEAEFDVLGIPFKERGAITDEYLRAIKVLWTEEIAEFAGTYVNFSNMVCDPHPVQKPGPPILIGGNSKAAMRRAARLGDGWHPWTVSPAELPACIEYIYEQPELQSNPRPFEIVMPMARLNVDDVTHQELGATRFPVTTEEVLDEVGTLRDLGSTGILTYFAPTSSLEEYLDRIAWFAEDIIPQFRN